MYINRGSRGSEIQIIQGALNISISGILLENRLATSQVFLKQQFASKRSELFRCFPLFSVELVGGSSSSEGNVYAKNPVSDVYGPVCDDGFDINAASFKYQ